MAQLFAAKDTVRKAAARRLSGFQTDFPFEFGAGFADPHNATAPATEWLLVQNDFDHLAAAEMETAAQPESLLRGIQD
jgi:hypothetical protein